MKVVGQKSLTDDLERVVTIFKNSNCMIRPHFALTGPSGSGKSLTISAIANKMDVELMEINCAQLTKEGTSGNSLSKALSPLQHKAGKPTIVFCDEFDKLFISGNSNSELAHETTNGVQNEFLKVLESDEASVFGDYGKYLNVSTKNCLFVFAGAFNGEENITINRLRDFGVKTEFLGRVGLVYNTKALTLDALCEILRNSPLLDNYMKLFTDASKETVTSEIIDHLHKIFDTNPLGARVVNTLIHKYFIKGGDLSDGEVAEVEFANKIPLAMGRNC